MFVSLTGGDLWLQYVCSYPVCHQCERGREGQGPQVCHQSGGLREDPGPKVCHQSGGLREDPGPQVCHQSGGLREDPGPQVCHQSGGLREDPGPQVYHQFGQKVLDQCEVWTDNPKLQACHQWESRREGPGPAICRSTMAVKRLMGSWLEGVSVDRTGGLFATVTFRKFCCVEVVWHAELRTGRVSLPAPWCRKLCGLTSLWGDSGWVCVPGVT